MARFGGAGGCLWDRCSRERGAGARSMAWAPPLTCLPALLDTLPAVGDALGYVPRAQDVTLVA